MTVPTADDFLERFPEFDGTDEAVIELAISDAARSVDSSWLEDDYAPAILSLAAHFLAAGAAQGEAITDGGGPPIKSETIGRISTTYGDAASSSTLMTTEYGSRFMYFFRRNRRRAVVV